MNPLLLAYYGDDFTGSADSMEALTINGVRTALFLGHPTRERLRENLGNLDAVGISGVSRTMTRATTVSTGTVDGRMARGTVVMVALPEADGW